MSIDRILVTGATGFLGRHVVSQMLSGSRSLTLAVRSEERCPPGWRTDDRVRLVATGDLQSVPNLNEAFAGVSHVVHLAGLAHLHGPKEREDDHAFGAANTEATAKLVEASTRAGVRTFINLSSLAAVTRNVSSGIVNDDTNDLPQTAYGRSKRAAEAIVAQLPQKGIFAISLRPPLIVGEDASGNWGSLLRLAAAGYPLPFANVRNARSMIGVLSLSEAISHLCSRPWPLEKSGNYCLADSETLSLPDIVTELRASMSMPPRLIPFPQSILFGAAALVRQRNRADGLLGTLVVDADRFRKTFGFQSSQGIRAAVRHAGAFYIKAPYGPEAGAH